VEESIEVVEGIYMGGNFEVLREMMQNGEVKHDQIRFFVGYSGWSPKQLDSELETNSWFVTQVKKEVLMNTRVKDLWKKIMSGLGKKGEMIANLPDDPKLN
jgi:putative transcriptional regulator